MTVLVSGRADLTLAAVRRAAWEGEPVALAPDVAERMAQAHAAFDAYLRARLAEDPGALLYGVTTGPGDAGAAVLSERARATRPPGLWTAASFGEPLPGRVVRAIVLARLANLVDGHAGARPPLAAAVAALLGGAPLPPVPARGNGGSGEILALGHLFGGLAERMELEPREKMALINGSPCAAALVADAALAGQGRLALAERVLALSAEAIRAPLDGVLARAGRALGRRARDAQRWNRSPRCSPAARPSASRTRRRSAIASSRGCSGGSARRRRMPSAPRRDRWPR